MIEIRESGLITKLLYILCITGEFPMCSISLLGNYQYHKRLISKATVQSEYYNPKTKERYTTRLLTVVGKGNKKTLRMLSGAQPILRWLDLSELYDSLHGEYRFTGKIAERERRHRVAEGYAMAYLAGLEINPIEIPKLQQETIKNLFLDRQCFYGSKPLKEVSKLELKKNIYTRIIGAVFANKNVYPVYNTRNEVMKWKGKGERKTLMNLEEIARMNAEIYKINRAILFGKNNQIALKTLENTRKSKRLEFCFDDIYPHLYFIPLNENGVRQLRILLLEDWREELLSILFTDDVRSFDKGSFEYDAKLKQKFILEFFDGDLTRLQRVRFALQNIKVEYEVLCFPFQVDIVKEYLGDLVKIKTVGLEVIESALGIGGEN